MPGINDAPEQVEEIVGWPARPARRASAARRCSSAGSIRDVFFDWLREHRPDLVARYERLYRNRARVTDVDRREIERAAGAPWAGPGRVNGFRQRASQRLAAIREAEREHAIEAAVRRRAREVQQALF